MPEVNHILLVDDDEFNIEIAKHPLGSEKYRYSVAHNGFDGLAALKTDRPDIILLDILMPHMDGLETCRRIRADFANNDIFIIFVTAKEDPETRLAAYDVGGDDILPKPLNAADLCHKVESAIKNRSLVASLRKEVTETMGMLMTSLSTTGEYGVVLNAIRSSLTSRSMGDLAEITLRALDDYGLRGTVQFRTRDSILTLNSERRSSPVEQEMLRSLSVENRHIYDYGDRSAFCYPNVAILVRNMPTANADQYGRMKDNLALLAEGMEYRLQGMGEEMRMRAERANLVTAASLLSYLLTQFNTQYKNSQSEMASIFNQLETQMEQELTGLVLTDDQERRLWSIIHPLQARISVLYEEGVELDQQLHGALDTLKTSLKESGAPS